MKNRVRKTVVLSLVVTALSFAVGAQTLRSPDGRISLTFKLDNRGRPLYSVNFNNRIVVKDSSLGFELKNQPALTSGFRILKSTVNEIDQTWKPVWGEVSQIRDHYRQWVFTL